MKITTAALAIIAASVFGGAVLAASHVNVEGAVKARKAHMQLHGFNLGILGNMAKGDVPYDAEAAQAAANNLHSLAMLDFAAYWPEGSSADDIEGTRALAAIWDDMPGVMEKIGALRAATETMAANAGTLEGVQGAMGAVGGACGACHQAYRQAN